MFGEYLEHIGINVGLAVSGFFGSLLTVGKHKSWRTAFIAVLSGMGSANYLTPVVLQFLPNAENSQYAAAFILGFLGLRGVELLTARLFPDEEDDTRTDNK
jgi:hypothetical protein